MKTLLLIAALLAPAIAAQTPTGTISGEIRTREGQPAVGVRVSAMAIPEPGAPASSGTALVSIASTDNQGRYRLDNVFPGRYYITAGFVELPTYYPGVSAVSAATAVQVLSGTPVTGINFAVANSVGVTVSGRVRRSTGVVGVGGQSVALIGGTPPVQQSTTAADGSFQILRVMPGTYQLSSAAGRTSAPVSVLVGDQDVTGLEIVVVPTVNLTGSVVIEGNAVRPRIQLQLSTFKGNGQTAGLSSQPDGTLRGLVPEGDYRVSWTSLPVGFEIKSVTAGSVDLLTSSLKVSADAPPEPIRILLSVEGNPWVKVSGRVTNLGATRTLMLSGPNVDQIQLTLNSDGTFEIPQVLPGQYQARMNIGVPTSAASSLLAVQSLVTQSISVVIPNQDTTNLIIPLPLTKVVEGIVVNSSGAAIQGRLSMNYQQTNGGSSSGGTRTFATSSDGKFALEIQPGGDVRFSVSAPGYSIKSMTYGTSDLLRDTMKVAMTDTAALRVVFDTTSTTIALGGAGGGASSVGGLTSFVVGGVPGGVITSSTGSILSAAPPPPPPPATPSPAASAANVNRVTAELRAALDAAAGAPPPPAPNPAASNANVNRVTAELAQSNIIARAAPVYPPLARTAQIQGSVVLQFEISVEGRVRNVSVVDGNPLLRDAALEAVRQWTYKPFVLNGQPIPVTTTATVNFTLQ